MRKTQRKRRLKEKRQRERERDMKRLERLLPIKRMIAKGARLLIKDEKGKYILVSPDVFRPLVFQDRPNRIMRAYERGQVVWK